MKNSLLLWSAKGKKWTEEDIELQNGCKLVCKSNISGIRGGAKLHKRYDLIILMILKMRIIHLLQRVDKKWKPYHCGCLSCFGASYWWLRINGTPVHFDSFINNLLTNNEKAKKKEENLHGMLLHITALDKKGNSLWDSWFSVSKLEEKKKFYSDSGMPHKFYQEYMMQVQSEEDSIFIEII